MRGKYWQNQVRSFILLALLNCPLTSPRIYLTSCGCLVCHDCGPRVLKGGHCHLCKTSSKVSAKPIGPKLSNDSKYFFLPLSAQPSLKAMERSEKFRQKHISRAVQLNANFGKVGKEKVAKLEKNKKEAEEDLRTIEKEFERKKKKVDNLEEEVNQLQMQLEQKKDVGKQKVRNISTATATVDLHKDEESFTFREGSPTDTVSSKSAAFQFLSSSVFKISDKFSP